MQANKNGFFYVLDRVTGEFISAEPFAPVSWAKGIDQKTGRPIVNPEAWYTSQRGVTVAPIQAHAAAPMAFNPTTGLVYFPANAAGTQTLTATDHFQFNPGSQTFGTKGRGEPPAPIAVPPTIGLVRMNKEGQPQRGGILSAWDPVAQKERWFVPGGGSNRGGALSTAGNLVFQALNDGRLLAYSADKGDKLLELQTGQTNGIGPPITFFLDGKQYVAIMGGTGVIASARGRGGSTNSEPPAKPRLYVYTVKGK